MTIHEYLANYSTNRNIDRIFILWYGSTYSTAYIQKEKTEWDSLFVEFMGESETVLKAKRESVAVVPIETVSLPEKKRLW